MTSNTTYLDEFVGKMYLVPNDINRHLRLIRALDKRAESVQQSLNTQQLRFLGQLKQHKQFLNGATNGSKKQPSQTTEIPLGLRMQYEKILGRQKQLYGYLKQKYEVSQQLRVMVGDFYEQLDNQLKDKFKQKTEEQRLAFDNRRKAAGKLATAANLASTNSIPGANITGKMGNSLLANGTISNNLYGNSSLAQNGQFSYDLKQPTYCYCGRASFGEMVMCENPYCEREWFHLDCIDEKNLPEKWYCLECQKQKDKTRNAVSRGFFINRDNQTK